MSSGGSRPRDRRPNSIPNHVQSSSNVKVNHNDQYPVRYTPVRKSRNTPKSLRSPVPQPAPPLEKTGYDYDYDSGAYDYDGVSGAGGDARASSRKYSNSDAGGKVLLSPKVSMYKNKNEKKDDLRSSRSSHRSENWTPPGNSRWMKSHHPPPQAKRTSESNRLNNYSRRGQVYSGGGRSHPISSPPTEYYYPDTSYDDYHHTHSHRHSHRPTSPRVSNRRHKEHTYHSVPSDDYPVDTYDTAPPKNTGVDSSSYGDSGHDHHDHHDHIPSLDAFYEKDSADGDGDNDSDDGSSDDSESGNNPSDVSEMDPESALTDDTNDNGHGEETLDDDDTKEVRSQTLYASGSDEIPDDMRLPYHNSPIDEREIASDTFLMTRELDADSLVDGAKQQPHSTE